MSTRPLPARDPGVERSEITRVGFGTCAIGGGASGLCGGSMTNRLGGGHASRIDLGVQLDRHRPPPMAGVVEDLLDAAALDSSLERPCVFTNCGLG